MLIVTSKEFENICNWAISTLPKNYISNLNNIAIVVEDDPNQLQRQQLHLVDGLVLFGLYEGVPLTMRGNNYNLVTPDKITIFKNPIINNCDSLPQLKEQIKRTIWHEIAHHYGLNHSQINKLLEKGR